MMKIMIAGGSKREYNKVKKALIENKIKFKQTPRGYHSQVPAYVFQFAEKDRKKALDTISAIQKSWMI